ncbi:MAG: hypothetical protein QXI58_03525 [Candidatus Micrarchaeia archaeon]
MKRKELFFIFAILFFIFFFNGCLLTEGVKEIEIIDLGCQKVAMTEVFAKIENDSLEINFPLQYYCSKINFTSEYLINNTKILIRIIKKEAVPTRCVCTHSVKINVRNATKECYQIEIYDGNEKIGKTNVGKKECPKFSSPKPGWYEECEKSGGTIISEMDDCGCLLPPKCVKNECKSDEDCATGGCSGEICNVKEIVENILCLLNFNKKIQE